MRSGPAAKVYPKSRPNAVAPQPPQRACLETAHHQDDEPCRVAPATKSYEPVPVHRVGRSFPTQEG